jgi:phage-related protein
LAELNKEFGGSAEAAARADGGMAMFKDRMGELAESIGAQLLPMLNSLLAWLNSPEVMAAITTIVNGLMQGLGAAFTWISTVAIPVLLAAFQVAWPIIQQTVQVVYAWLHDVFWPWMQTAMTNIVTWVNTAQAGWSAAWSLISGAVESAKNTISGVIATIKSLVQGAIDKINALIGLINSIPGVNIPSIPSVGGGGLSRGGGSGFGTNSAGSFASLGASSASTTTSNVIHIDARNATDPRGVADNVRHALDQAGIRGELRTRMA